MVEPDIQIEERDGRVVVRFHGPATAEIMARSWRRLMDVIGNAGTSRFTLDFRSVSRFDSAAPALAAALCRAGAERGVEVEVLAPSEHFQHLLDVASARAGAAAESGRSGFLDRITSAPVRVGEATIQTAEAARRAIEFVGELALGLWRAVRNPRSVRGDALLAAIEENGSDAVPIVALISFLIGVITAFQAAVQLHDFGADVYVADLVGLSLTRELGPIMVAIICAGRSGAGMAAELGAMTVNDEVEAMHTMGLDVFRFLVIPRILAMLLALPCLTLFGDIVGVGASMITSRVVLELPFTVYWNETLQAVALGDIAGGLVKTFVFAIIIAGVGCERGLSVRHDPRSVGRAATSAVVLSIFGIILADALFAVLYNAMGV